MPHGVRRMSNPQRGFGGNSKLVEIWAASHNSSLLLIRLQVIIFERLLFQKMLEKSEHDNHPWILQIAYFL